MYLRRRGVQVRRLKCHLFRRHPCQNVVRHWAAYTKRGMGAPYIRRTGDRWGQSVHKPINTVNTVGRRTGAGVSEDGVDGTERAGGAEEGGVVGIAKGLADQSGVC